jgi:hypothetical protein
VERGREGMVVNMFEVICNIYIENSRIKSTKYSFLNGGEV